MKQEVKIGQTDYTVLMLVRDTAGAPKTGLVFNSAGIDICYTRVETDNDVVLTAGAPVDLATPLLTDPHLDWGFLEVDATNAPGLYRVDLPDAVFASGAWSAVVSFICTGCDPVHLEFILVPEAPYNGVDVYSIGGTAQTANDNGADINDILVDTGTTLQAELDAIQAAVITNAAGADIAADIIAVKAETANILTDTGTTLDTLIKDIPTVAEFEARTIVAANYLEVADITGAEVDNDGTAISIAGAFKLLLSALTAKSSGGGTATLVFRDINDSKNRLSMTVDADGNRTAVGTRDAT